MGNCLKTQLKEVVNNDNLKVLGAFYLEASVGNGRFNGGIPTNSTWEIVGDGTFTDSDYTIPVSSVKKVTVSASSYIYFHANEAIRIYCKDNHQVATLNGGTSTNVSVAKSDIDYRTITTLYRVSLKGNFVETGYFKDLTGNINLLGVDKLNLSVLEGNNNGIGSFILATHNVEGDISVLDGLNISGNIDLTNSSVIGDVAVLGKFVNSGIMSVQNTMIHGTIESVVEGLWTNGKRSGQITLNTNFTSVTLDNKVFAHGNTIKFTNAGVTIEYPEGTTVATYNGSTWSYNM